MENEMTERVARAIEAGSHYVISQHHAKTLARAAILAMREATPAMVKAEADLGGPANRMPATLVFDVMIVAALTEAP